MNLNYLLIFLTLLSSTATFLINGYFMIKEKDDIKYTSLDNPGKIYISLLLYNEFYIGVLLIYFYMLILMKFIFSCYSNGSININYSLYKALFFFSGIASHVYTFMILITTTKDYINHNIFKISIVFTINAWFIIFITILFNICKKYSNNYDNLN